MQIKFIVDPDYTFLHAINHAQSEEPFAGWGDFTNQIWKEDPAVYWFLAGAPERALYLQDQSAADLSARAEKKMAQIRQSEPFKKLVTETEQYRDFVNDQWVKNEKACLEMLTEMSGLQLPEDEIEIFITHPELKNGMVVDDRKIAWGHREDFPNYASVYVCHELMHIMTDHNDSDEVHALIELMTDNEIRIRLNGAGEYFGCRGHAHLRELEKKILPIWREYLGEDQKDFWGLVEKMKNVNHSK